MVVFLIGFMGSGKSYVGRHLAARLNIRFFDLDEAIEKAVGKSIAAIFEQDGETAFRLIEQQQLQTVSNSENIILATGGGTPCFLDNMEFMNQKGITIYLRTSTKILLERLQGEKEQRPLLKDKFMSELQDYIHIKVEEREKYYREANIIYTQSTGQENIIEELGSFLLRIIRP